MSNPIYRADNPAPKNWAGDVERGDLPEPGGMADPNTHNVFTSTDAASGTAHQGESGVPAIQPWTNGSPCPTANVDQGNTTNNWADLASIVSTSGAGNQSGLAPHGTPKAVGNEAAKTPAPKADNVNAKRGVK